ncbi:5'-methylthioadenosine/S-adenosylhomocysteine nucleosidase family protein [Singulisphaera rosea]
MVRSKRLAVIITALPVERDAVREHLRSVSEEPPLNGSIYRRGIFDDRSEPWDVILAEIGAGNITAAAEAIRVIDHYEPDIALFVGVAGAIKDLTHGDVIASTKIYAYESGKDQDKGFKPRVNVNLSDYELEQRARNEAGEPHWRERIKQHDTEQRTPTAKVGPIASGEKVLASGRSDLYKFITSTYSDALAVEMEGHGFLHGVRMNRHVMGIVIRGISDGIRDKRANRDEDWQPIASRHAAAFAFQILAKQADAAGGSPAHLARTIEQSPGVQKLDAHWKALRSIAEHTLDATVFTTSRDREANAVSKWLTDPPDSLQMHSAGSAEELDFLAALGSTEPLKSLQDALIVSDLAAWRTFSAWQRPLILIAGPNLQLQATDISGAVQAGHHVFVVGGGSAGPLAEKQQLNRQDHYALGRSLASSGYSDARARSLAQASCGSSAILKRLITRHPNSQFPRWAREEFRSSLAPFALIGGWGIASDTWLVTDFSKFTSDELDVEISRWSRGSEPLLLRFGESILVTSREDTWYLLGGSISPDLLKRFCDLALFVLEEDNPAFQLEADQRWLAQVVGKVRELSEELRRSIVETLALMTTYKTAEDPNLDFKRVANDVLKKALPEHATWERWASFGNNLTVVSEADPEFFLTRVEDDLNSSEPELPKLFQDQTHSIFSSSQHYALLWSLEGLAWNPPYLNRVSIILAKLATSEPGGVHANRPEKSLKEIFLPWFSRTNASISERVQALRCVFEVEPDIGWTLLATLLPDGTPSCVSPTHTPRWRPWADGWSRERCNEERLNYQIEIANVVAEIAGLEPRKWADVLEGMLRADPKNSERVFRSLDQIADLSANDNESVHTLWRKLRDLVARHEEFASEPWAFPPSIRNRLSTIRDNLAPTDPVLLHRHLFGHNHPNLPGLNFAEELREYETKLRSARLDALHQVISTAGSEGVLRLFDYADSANEVGRLVGEERLLGVVDMGLPTSLDRSDDYRPVFISAYLRSRHLREGQVFVNEIPTVGWSPTQLASLGCRLGFNREIWDWIEQHGPEVVKQYWSRVRGYLQPTDFEEVRIACEALVGAGRPLSAVGNAHSATHHGISLPSDFVAVLLEATLEAKGIEEGTSVNSCQYALQEFVKALQEDGSFDRGRLVRIEWGLLPVLDKRLSKVRATTLIGDVLSHPNAFISLVSTAFHKEGDASSNNPISEQDLALAKNAKDLLDELSQLPGANDSSDPDYDSFRSWTESVRSMAASEKRLRACDNALGRLIARATFSPSGNWPPPAVSKFMEQLGSNEVFGGFFAVALTGQEQVQASWGSEVQERAASNSFRKLAEFNRPYSPKLAKVFVNIAEYHESHARQAAEDEAREKIGR